MEINWIEDFMTLCVTRNFSRAAETRNVSQPAFSRRIRNLEYWVGTPLLDRSVFPIALTPAGEAFRKRAEDVLRSLQYAREEARGMVARPDEVISFASLHTLGINFFPRWLTGIEAALGRLKTRVLPDNLSGCVEALISGSCDVMLCYSHPGVVMSLDAARFPRCCWRRTASCRSAPPMRRAVPATIRARGRQCPICVIRPKASLDGWSIRWSRHRA